MGNAVKLAKYTDHFLSEVVVFEWVTGTRQRSKTMQKQRNVSSIGV